MLLAGLFALAAGGVAWLVVGRSEGNFRPPGELVSDEHFGDYEVKIYRHNEESFFERMCDKLPARLASICERVRGDTSAAGFEILKHGRRMHAQYGNNFGIAEVEGGGVVMGRDITGDGTPKIALTDGIGRQGGGELLVFECGEQFRLIADVESLGTFPTLKDLDGDGIPELIVSDNEFYHWPVCMDGEPMPEVILRWRDGKYVAAKDLMRKPAPTPDELRAKAEELRASPAWDSGSVPEGVWTNALALMYEGHEALGWAFVESAWKPGFPGKGDSSKEQIIDYYLRGKLEDSVYWREIRSSGLEAKGNAGVKR